LPLLRTAYSMDLSGLTTELPSLETADYLGLGPGPASAPALTSVSTVLYLYGSVTDFPVLTDVGGLLTFAQATGDFPSLSYVYELDVYAPGGPFTLDELLYVDSTIYVTDGALSAPQLTSAGALWINAGNLSAPQLQTVYGSVEVNNATLDDLGQLSSVDGSVALNNSTASFSALSQVGGNVRVTASATADLSKLSEVSGELLFSRVSLPAKPAPLLTSANLLRITNSWSTAGGVSFPQLSTAGVQVNDNSSFAFGTWGLDLPGLVHTRKGSFQVLDNDALSDLTVGPLFQGNQNAAGDVFIKRNYELDQCTVLDIQSTLWSNGFTGVFDGNDNGLLCAE
jgi:hypothetical protein